MAPESLADPSRDGVEVIAVAGLVEDLLTVNAYSEHAAMARYEPQTGDPVPEGRQQRVHARRNGPLRDLGDRSLESPAQLNL